MSKYSPLGDMLAVRAAAGEQIVDLRFGEIDRLVGGLPPSALRLRNWWANNSQNHALVWREAGRHVGSVDFDSRTVRFVRGRVGGSYSDRGRAIGSERLTKHESEYEPTGIAVEVSAAFEWLSAGDVLLGGDGKLAFPELPSDPGIYWLKLTGRSLSRQVWYFGESDNLRRRAGNYRSSGPRQRTSLRIHELLCQQLAAGASVELLVVTQVLLSRGGDSPKPLDLTRKASRLLAENAALVDAQILDAAQIENLGR